MNLIIFHKILIYSAVAFSLFYGVWELLKYPDIGGFGALARSLMSFLAAAGFAIYIRTVKKL